MIKIKAVALTNPKLDKLLKLFDTYPKQVFDLAEATYKELQPGFVQTFRQQPRVRSYPGDYPGGQLPFDTERQRRWYWANIGKPYVRSGRMAAALQQTSERDAKSFTITARYGSPSTKYALGNIWGDHSPFRSYQQRFHKATGWQQAGLLLDQQEKTYLDRFTRRYEAFIAFYGK